MMTLKTVVWTVLSVLVFHNITEVTAPPSDSPWWPGQCARGYYKCGDICVHESRRCYCGGDDWNWKDDKEDKRYCCVPPGGYQCTRVSGNINCQSGVLLPWYQPCHGDNCTLSPIVIKKNNCQYDCLARSDEVSVKQNDKIIDQYADLKNCTNSDGDPGLKGTITNGVCKRNHQWCTEDISCHSEVSRDRLQLQRFCQNPTFWQSQDCKEYSYKVEITVRWYGERCMGSQQHCYYPAYMNYNYEIRNDTGLLAQCKDKSDQIFDKHSHCNISATMDIYCEYCRDNRSYWHWKDKGKIGGDCDIFPMQWT